MKSLGVLVLAMLCVACGARRLDTLQVPPNEAAVIGKIQITFNGQDVTDGSAVLFNEKTWGTYGYSVPKDGWILTKLPLGQNHIARLAFAKFFQGNFFYDFTPTQTGFVLPGGGQVYYIGHIVVDWTGRGFKPSMLFGLAGAIVDQMSSDGTIKMAVNDRRAEAMQELTARFKSRSPPAISLLGKPAGAAAAPSRTYGASPASPPTSSQPLPQPGGPPPVLVPSTR